MYQGRVVEAMKVNHICVEFKVSARQSCHSHQGNRDTTCRRSIPKQFGTLELSISTAYEVVDLRRLGTSDAFPIKVL